MRRFAVSAGLLLAAWAGVVLPVPQAQAGTPGVVVTPERGVLPMSPALSGSCPGADSPDGTVFPSETVLTLVGSGSGPWKVPLAEDGTFTGFVAELSGDAAPGSYTFTTTCGGSAPFAALAAPTLHLDPPGTGAGGSVVVTGTCPRPPGGEPAAPAVFLDERFLDIASLDAATGELGPSSVTVPAGTEPGARQVSTSCGGAATVTVAPPVAVQVTAPPRVAAPQSTRRVLVVVPDLRGRTEQQAVTALAGHLVLAGGGTGAGVIRSQNPAPGTRVPPGSTVHVVLAAAVAPAASGTFLPPLVTAAIGLLAVLVAVALVISRILRHRERRWVESHVAVTAGASFLLLSDVPHQDVPGLDVALVVHRDSGPQFADTEVSHGCR